MREEEEDVTYKQNKNGWNGVPQERCTKENDYLPR